jgi:hypothetical protein
MSEQCEDVAPVVDLCNRIFESLRSIERVGSCSATHLPCSVSCKVHDTVKFDLILQQEDLKRNKKI